MSQPNRPRLHPWIPLLVRHDGRVIAATGPRAGHGFTPADSGAVLAAARSADGRRSWSALCEDPLVARGLGLLWQQGALVDGDEVVAAGLAPAERDALSRARLSALTGPRRPSAPVERRRELTVILEGPAALAESVVAALRTAGIASVKVRPGHSRRRRTNRMADPEWPAGRRVEVVIGRPGYQRMRRWMLDGVTHLAISPRADSVRVGPLVVPGVTSCLQCLHLIRCDRHADWPTLWDQLSRAPVPEPDPALMQHASALAARSLVEYAQTGSAAVTDAFVQVTADDLSFRMRMAPRHPLCGCWWPPAPVDD